MDTCKNIVDEENEDECYFEFEFKFCPNCGRRVTA